MRSPEEVEFEDKFNDMTNDFADEEEDVPIVDADGELCGGMQIYANFYSRREHEQSQCEEDRRREVGRVGGALTCAPCCVVCKEREPAASVHMKKCISLVRPVVLPAFACYLAARAAHFSFLLICPEFSTPRFSAFWRRMSKLFAAASCSILLMSCGSAEMRRVQTG